MCRLHEKCSGTGNFSSSSFIYSRQSQKVSNYMYSVCMSLICLAMLAGYNKEFAKCCLQICGPSCEPKQILKVSGNALLQWNQSVKKCATT